MSIIDVDSPGLLGCLLVACPGFTTGSPGGPLL